MSELLEFFCFIDLADNMAAGVSIVVSLAHQIYDGVEMGCVITEYFA